MKTQKEIKDLLAENLGVSKAEVDRFLREYCSIITESLLEDGGFKIPLIGTLKIRYRSARQGINPRTKEPLNVNASLSVGLTASDSLKEKVNMNLNIEDYKK